jgi:hypothetical protein
LSSKFRRHFPAMLVILLFANRFEMMNDVERELEMSRRDRMTDCLQHSSQVSTDHQSQIESLVAAKLVSIVDCVVEAAGAMIEATTANAFHRLLSRAEHNVKLAMTLLATSDD